MPRVHVLTNKDCARPERLRSAIAVVVDAIFATTGIAVMIGRGAAQIVPLADAGAALSAASGYRSDEVVFVGEKEGESIPGFLEPWPIDLLARDLRGKTVLYSTTNGTIALQRAATASLVLAASPVNAHAVADHIRRHHENRNIVLICAGSGGAFSLEDFYGAGCVASHLASFEESFALSDAANAARLLHDNTPARECIFETYAGRMMSAQGRNDDLNLVTGENVFDVVPVYANGRIRNAGRPSRSAGDG
jgi:2-phosphosulfolactate phosphatase